MIQRVKYHRKKNRGRIGENLGHNGVEVLKAEDAKEGIRNRIGRLKGKEN